MKKKSVGRKILKVVLIVLCVIILILAAGIGTMSALEYRPADVEDMDVRGEGSETIGVGGTLDVMTWNIGYCGLGASADFFMDGGTSVRSQTEEQVKDNLQHIYETISAQDADVVLLQEVDFDSSRSYRINQLQFLSDKLSGFDAFAPNYKAAFVPYPLPPLGKIYSGIVTMTDYPMLSAQRIQLPCPFAWPIRTVNLKRCLLVTRVDLEDTDKELILINLHLEAYDSGEGKIAQTKMLAELMQAEYDKGNYVIAGGDFNQTFSGTDISMYPVQKEGLWEAGRIEESAFSKDMLFFMDTTHPTCRSLDRALDLSDPTFQFYMIDGFIVSNNFTVESLETMDMGFAWSDHNPVKIRLTLN